jgi:hypothetical protein
MADIVPASGRTLAGSYRIAIGENLFEASAGG